MKTIISSLALASILLAPLAAVADTTNVPAAQPAAVAMQSSVTTGRAKSSDDERQAVGRVEQQSRQLGPTN